MKNQGNYLLHLDLLIDPVEHTIICPKCGHNYTHIVEVFTRLGADPPGDGVAYAGTIAKGVVLNERHGCLVIRLAGECGHLFEWHIQQYKGYNFVHSVVTGRDPSFDWSAEDREENKQRELLSRMIRGDLEPLDVLVDPSFEGFSVDRYKRVFSAMCDLQRSYMSIDRVTVANELMKKNELESIGGLSFLVELSSEREDGGT